MPSLTFRPNEPNPKLGVGVVMGTMLTLEKVNRFCLATRDLKMGFGAKTIARLAGKLAPLAQKFRTATLLILPALLIYLAASPELPAGFSRQAFRTHVEIEGVDFGGFDGVVGVDDESGSSLNSGQVRRVVLQRDFVTDPSLYLWAKNTMKERSGLKDIHLVMENRDGDEIARYVLKSCQPVSWSVEAAALSSGGFHERIELAVQGVEVD